jgi:hypothetical protein
MEQTESAIEPHKVTTDPRIDASGRIKTSRSNCFGECSTESGNEPMEIPANSNSETIDSLPVSSKSSNVGEEIKEARVLTSHKRKKSQEIRSNESNPKITQERRSLARKYKKINCSEITNASEPKSKETSDPSDSTSQDS